MRLRTFALAVMLLAPLPALATPTDEIQVYTGEIMGPGEVGLAWHNNYTISGATTPDFPGALVNNHAYSSVLEWAFGVTDWFEAGLYMPLYANTSQGWTYNGFKLRALFVQPHNEDKDFYYGVNFEFSWNQRVWDGQVNTGEIRPIIGWRLPDGWSFTVNPIIDNAYKGGIAGLEFVPSMRLDKEISKSWTVGVETYSDFGQFRAWLPWKQQSQNVWLVGDYSGNPISVEFGAGFGLTPASDSFAVKLMLMSDLTGEHSLFNGWGK